MNCFVLRPKLRHWYSDVHRLVGKYRKAEIYPNPETICNAYQFDILRTVFLKSRGLLYRFIVAFYFTETVYRGGRFFIIIFQGLFYYSIIQGFTKCHVGECHIVECVL